MNVDWVSDEGLKEINLQKTDFLVFHDFEGQNFDEIKETKSA